MPGGLSREADYWVEGRPAGFWAEEKQELRVASERAFGLYRCSFVVMLSCWTARLSFSPPVGIPLRCWIAMSSPSRPLGPRPPLGSSSQSKRGLAKTSLIRPSWGGDRPDTRSRTAAVCPFKSFGRETVLSAGKAAGQPRGGALVAQRHGNHCGAAVAREIGTRIEQHA